MDVTWEEVQIDNGKGQCSGVVQPIEKHWINAGVFADLPVSQELLLWKNSPRRPFGLPIVEILWPPDYYYYINATLPQDV